MKKDGSDMRLTGALAVLGLVGVVIYLAIPDGSKLQKDIALGLNLGISSAALLDSVLSLLRRRRNAAELYEEHARYLGYVEQTQRALVGKSPGFGHLPSHGGTAGVTGDRDIQLDQTVAGMMANNAALTRTFHEDTARSARLALRLAAALCILGIVAIMVAVALMATGMIDAGLAIATSVGGVIAEVGGATTLALQERASKQADTHFSALHENERALYAMSVADRIKNDGKRDETLADLARGLVTRDSVVDRKGGVGYGSDGE